MDPRKLGLSEEDLTALGYEVRRGAEPSGPAAALDGGGPPSRPEGAVRGNGSGLRRWMWTVGLLLAAGWSASSARQTMAPVPANRPDSVFSSGRAMSQLVEVARAPRPPGSPEHARVGDYVRDRLDALGLDPVEVGRTVARVSDATADVVTQRHVMGRIPGSASSGTILLTAGYDSPPGSPGAGGSGLGVAALLETARVLTSSGPMRNDVVVFFQDGTTAGTPPGVAIPGGHPWIDNVSLAIRFDARGVSGPVWALPGPVEGGSLERLVAGVVPRPTMSSASEAVGLLRGDAGRVTTPTVTLTALGGRGVHGTALDRARRVSEGTLAHGGTQIVALVRDLGGLDLRSAPWEGEAARAYQSVRGLGVVGYPRTRALPVTGGVVLLWIVLLGSLRMTGGSPRGVLVGVGVGVLSTALAAASGLGVLEVMRRTHPEMGRTPAGIWEMDPYFATVVAAAFATTTALVALARSRVSARELWSGALLVPVGFTLWLSVGRVGGAPPAQFATGFGLVLALLFTWLPARLARTGLAWAASLGLGSCILFAMVPALEWTAAWNGAGGLAATGAFVGVASLLLLPLVEWLRRPRPWLAPLTGAAAAAAFLWLGSYRASVSDANPEPTSLVLLVDDSTTALSDALPINSTDSVSQASPPVGGGAEVVRAPAPTRSVAGTWLTVPGAGEAWARSWAVPGRVPREPGDLLLPEEVEWVAAGAGPAAPLGSVRVTAHELGVIEGARRVRLVVDPGLGGEMVALRVPEGSTVSVQAVDGTSLDVAAGVRRVRRWRPAHGASVSFDLRVPDAGSFQVDVMEHHLRPKALLGGGFFDRDETVVPDATTGGDRLIQRVSVTVPAG